MRSSNSKVKVSVVIPIYNSQQYLGECLNTVVNQTLYDIEIICINDGSTDNSSKILFLFLLLNTNVFLLRAMYAFLAHIFESQ